MSLFVYLFLSHIVVFFQLFLSVCFVQYLYYRTLKLRLGTVLVQLIHCCVSRWFSI